MAETVIEDFTSVTDWTNLVGTLVATGGQGAGSAATDNFAYLTAGSYGPDVFIGVTVAAVPADNEGVFVCARITNLPSANGYFTSFVKSSGTDTMYLRRLTGGAPTTLNSWPQEVAAGNRIGIRCVGSTISAYVDTGSGWTLVGSVTDTNHAGAGTVAIDIFNTAARVDDLVLITDDAVAAPTGQMTPMGIW